MEHQHIWEALHSQGVQAEYITLLQDLYRDQTGRVKTDVTSKIFRIERGTKQGDPLSSLLFNALLEHIMRPIKSTWERKKFGIKLNDDPKHTITNLRFADDVLLVGKTLREVEQMLTDIKREANKTGLELHPDKTKVLSNTTKRSGRPNKQHITLDNDNIEILPRSDHIKYLGRSISFENANTLETNQRIRAAWAKFSTLRQELTNKHYRLRDRLRLFESTVSPTLLYGCEALTLTRNDEHAINRAQRRMLRMMIGAGRRKTKGTMTTEPNDNNEHSESDNDIQSNPEAQHDDNQAEQEDDNHEDLEPWHEWMKRVTQQAENLLQKFNIKSWISAIRTRKWRLVAKTMNMPPQRWTRLALTWDPQQTSKSARRCEGHPRKRWTDDIDNYLCSRGMSKSCLKVAKNTTTWACLEGEYIKQQ